MTAAEAARLLADGTVGGGMIPKVKTCLDAVAGGVAAAAPVVAAPSTGYAASYRLAISSVRTFSRVAK